MLFRLSAFCLWAGVSSLAAAPPSTLRKRDADFESVRIPGKLKHDHSGKGGDPKEKYFHESTFHPHYDGRFADHTLKEEEQHGNLTALMQTYLSTMHDIGAKTWIMHGSLLGWWWNRGIMPWDSDVDVQMSYNSMKFLADYYNMTVHHFKLPGFPKGKDFLIEVNPRYVNGSTADRLNVIDARWIDTETGLFIDITTLRKDEERAKKGEEGWMYSKDKHRFKEADIFPLRDTVFEDTPVKIPYAYTKLLQEEYGTKSMTQTKYHDHIFDQEKMEWIPTK